MMRRWKKTGSWKKKCTKQIWKHGHEENGEKMVCGNRQSDERNGHEDIKSLVDHGLINSIVGIQWKQCARFNWRKYDVAVAEISPQPVRVDFFILNSLNAFCARETCKVSLLQPPNECLWECRAETVAFCRVIVASNVTVAPYAGDSVISHSTDYTPSFMGE